MRRYAHTYAAYTVINNHKYQYYTNVHLCIYVLIYTYMIFYFIISYYCVFYQANLHLSVSSSLLHRGQMARSFVLALCKKDYGEAAAGCSTMVFSCNCLKVIPQKRPNCLGTRAFNWCVCGTSAQATIALFGKDQMH